MQWSNLDSANRSFLRHGAERKTISNCVAQYIASIFVFTIDRFVNLAPPLDDIEAHSTNLVLMWASEECSSANDFILWQKIILQPQLFRLRYSWSTSNESIILILQAINVLA